MSKRSKNKKQQPETSKPVNYDLFNQKITFEFLKSHLWAAADILRGSLDHADISDPDNRYINQPEKGPSFHTDEFMDGYDNGYVECSDVSNPDSSGRNDELAEWIDSCRNAGYDDGQNGPFSEPTYDHCGDEKGGDDAYYNGFIDGCMSVEGNTRDVCESATDS